MQPVLDKGLGIARLSGQATQLILPKGQRSELPESGLQNDDPDRDQMRYAKYSIVNP